MADPRKLVLTVSLGNRPWFQMLRPYMAAYAHRWQADFRVVTQGFFETRAFNRDLGCRNDKVQAIHDALYSYDQVLYLDDTVFVRPHARLLAIGDGGSPRPLVAMVESRFPLFSNWQQVLSDAFRYYGVAQRESVLFNSGVMLLHQEHQILFDLSQSRPLERIGWLVDQAWLNVMRQKHGFPLLDLGPEYNFLGSFVVGRTAAPIPLDQAQFVHLTRGVGDGEARLRLTRELIDRFGG